MRRALSCRSKHAILASHALLRSYKRWRRAYPAIFLDRDGTINVDHGYVHEIDNFEFIDGVIDAMRELKKMGFALVVVTNQSGIARGKFTEAQFETLTEWMDWSLADRDVDLDGIYYCPHHPQGSVEEFRQVCDCRKPTSGDAFVSTRLFAY
ncbi:D,D-heptose 1,7-bisphosphate phosphatase [Escherichia coli]|uniref:D-glycero-beta-D-manno-heptose-1,7-bisphosphate 7-phosphatase n=1 Tax=Escherichia coli TaxID=562 RepID=A0A376MSH8_ECOLX|nr:D,D-heptose 1,7-bisphosphate phosphatase [Escherichia coli]